MIERDDAVVTVCAECRRASCWYAEFFCDNARTANVVEVSRFVLLSEQREHPSYLSDEYVEKVTGEKPQSCVHDFKPCGSAMGEVHLSKCTKCTRVLPTDSISLR